MKIELLTVGEKWVATVGNSVKGLLETYPDATLVTETNEHDYYASNEHFKILFRITKPKPMTKQQAEEKYGIRIIG